MSAGRCNQPNIYYCERGSLSYCMCNSDIGCFSISPSENMVVHARASNQPPACEFATQRISVVSAGERGSRLIVPLRDAAPGYAIGDQVVALADGDDRDHGD